MVTTLQAVAESSYFQNFITAIILLAGVLVGMETYPYMSENYGGVLGIMNSIVLWIFVGEIIVKMGAEGTKPIRAVSRRICRRCLQRWRGKCCQGAPRQQGGHG